MKKIISLSLILALLLCGCNTVPPSEESATENATENAVQKSDIPEIKKEAKVSRWYEEFTDTLIPRDDYGELVIFTGGYCHDESNGYSNEHLFGLMTLDGKIVVDPVFNSYQTYELDGKNYYNMMIVENELYEGGEYSCTSMLVASDGSWCVTVDGDIDHITPERIFTSKYDEYFKCYDYDGNLIFEGGENLHIAWNYGTSSHTKLLGAYDWSVDDHALLVFDLDGNVVFDEFRFFVSFESGKSVVQLADTQLYGIITDSGEWLLEPVYSYIDSVEDEYFVAVLDNTEVEVYDKDVNLIHSFTTIDYNSQTRYYEIVGDRLLYYCGHIDAKDDYYRDMFTDEIITCKENGLPATRYSEEDGTFSLTDENGTEWYFDVDGNVTDKVEMPEGADTDADHNEESDSTVNSHEYEDYETEYLDYKGYPNLAIINHIRLVEWPVIKGISKLINYKTGEVFLENCEDIEISEYGGKQFMTVVYKDYIYIYDEDFNLIMGIENALYD